MEKIVTSVNYSEMKAFIKTKYGGPEVLSVCEVEKPSLKEGHILVKVEANSVNPADWHILRGKPVLARFSFGLFKPKNKIPGADFAGTVVETGTSVRQFKAGDRVFGENLTGGAFAEYTVVAAKACGSMPEGTSFAEMAGVPIAGVTALQALVAHGNLKKGESVLINGASGGVGHFAVQLAKAWGAEVTAVCSGRNAGFVTKLGADKVVAYDKENIHQHNKKYNLVVDVHGNLTHSDFKRMGERGVVVGFTTLGHMISVLIKRNFSKIPVTIFTAQPNTKDLEVLAHLIKGETVKVHIDKTYSWKDIPEAIRYIEGMHARGKVVMLWEPSGSQKKTLRKQKVQPDLG